MINPGRGIGWSPNTNFDGVNIQPLFDDNFLPRSTRKQGDRDVTTPTFYHKLQKTQRTYPSNPGDYYLQGQQ